MAMLDELKELGVDIEDAGRRLNNNMALYEKLVKKFPAQVEKLPVLSCYDNGDNKSSLENAHTLKGMTSNLSMVPLYVAYGEAVKLMRQDNYEEAIEKVKGVIDVQNKIVEVINKYQ